MNDFYRRYLPHWHPPEATFFITFRLAGTLPREVVEQIERELHAYRQQKGSLSWLEEERYRFQQYERWLEQYRQGPTWLEPPAIGGVVRAEIHRLDQRRYTLLAYCIMPNHVHLLLDFAGYPPSPEKRSPSLLHRDFLNETLRLLKGRSARFANQYLQRRGRFWQPESYDHVVRSPQSLLRIARYIANNPVSAGLVRVWQHWPFTWVHPELAVESGLLEESPPSGRLEVRAT